MEDMMFSLFLFVIFYTFLVWLFLVPAEPAEIASAKDDTAWNMNQDGEIVLDNEKGQVTITPIERQLHDVLWESNKVSTTVITKGSLSPITGTILEDIQVDKITLRTARKIAKALDIRQKVKGKDQPKKWLVAQIKKALEDDPTKVAPIIRSCDRTA